MTQAERAVKLSYERDFKRRQPTMPKGRDLPVVRDKHYLAVYGRSTSPVNPPRVKGDPTGRKVAVKVEGSRSWGKDPNWGGDRNGEAGAPSAINRQALAMEQRVERQLGQWRKERRDFNARGPIPFIVRPGVEQPPMKAPPSAPRFVGVLSAEQRQAEQATAPTWGVFGDKTLHTFRKRWR